MDTLFVDIGGVLLTNGWDKVMRQKAAQRFDLDIEEFNARHALVFDTYEEGKLTLDEYIVRTVFWQNRDFTEDQFKDFMFSQSKPLPGAIDMLKKIKSQHQLKVVAVSNEGRELSDYRVNKFGLKELIDIFIVSGYVHLRKPDPEFYLMALDLAQVEPNQVIYIEDRQLFVEVAQDLGIRSIQHKSVASTKAAIESLLALVPG